MIRILLYPVALVLLGYHKLRGLIVGNLPESKSVGKEISNSEDRPKSKWIEGQQRVEEIASRLVDRDPEIRKKAASEVDKYLEELGD